MQIDQVKAYLFSLQASICSALAQEDGSAAFITDEWQRSEGGGGRSRVLAEGAVFEKAGVNFSHVMGENLPPSASASRPELAGRSYQAMGVSLVVHPNNPYVPTSHASTGKSHVVWEGCFLMISTNGTLIPRSALCSRWETLSFAHTGLLSAGVRILPLVIAKGSFSFIVGVVTLSSIWSSTEVLCLDCNQTGAPRRY